MDGGWDPARAAQDFAHRPFAAHALLDSGDGQKLERFGERLLVRPDPQALWRRRDPACWQRADLVFVRESDRGGRWERPGAERAAPAPRGRGDRATRRRRDDPGADEEAAAAEGPSWTVELPGLRVVLRATPFKHVGLFPEQATNWHLLERAAPLFGERPRLLNLFGYTGVASLVAHRAGFAVTHVDASRLALSWARENLAAAGLSGDALRLVLDDALGFARREERRGHRYHAILVDPPRYGRGPKGETWRFEEHVAPLLETLGALFEERSLLVLSTYAIGISPLTLDNLLAPLRRPGDRFAVGELALPEEERAGAAARPLPCGFCARLLRGF